MRVLFLVPYPKQGASNRYRVEQYAPFLDRRGIAYSIRPFWSEAAFRILYTRGNHLRKTFYFIMGAAGRLMDMFVIRRYDLVFIHREAFPVGPAVFEAVLHAMRKPVIFDFDDAIFLASSSSQNEFIGKFKYHDKVKDIIRMSSHVIAGNSYLASFARAYNRNVSVIPTVIDTDRLSAPPRKNHADVVIGWIGSATTSDFLKPMAPVFSEILRRFDNVRIVIIGGVPEPGISSDRIRYRPWSLSTEARELESFDIGIMPMPDDPWTQGKCGFKAILYMGMAVPCVCSAVGANNEIITDGINGFLARTEAEWIERLSLLVRDGSLRRRIGEAGRKTVEADYSLKAYSARFVGILVDVMQSGGESA